MAPFARCVSKQRPSLNCHDWVAVTHNPEGTTSFTYRASGTPGMILFLSVFLILWGGFLAAMLLGAMETPTALVVFFAAGECVTGLILLWMVFGRTRITLGSDSLLIERRLGFIRRTSDIPRESIRAVRQIEDNAENPEPDSFPTWSLKIEAERDRWVLFRQEQDRSAWLGSEIANWAGVPYTPAPHATT